MSVAVTDDLLIRREAAQEAVDRILAPGRRGRPAVAAMLPSPAAPEAPKRVKGRVQGAALDLLAVVNPVAALRHLLGPELTLTPGKLERLLQMRCAGKVLKALGHLLDLAGTQRFLRSGPQEGLRKRAKKTALAKLGWEEAEEQWPFDPSRVVVRVLRAKLVRKWFPEREDTPFFALDTLGALSGPYAERLLAMLGQQPRKRFPDGTTYAQRLEMLTGLIETAGRQMRQDRDDAMDHRLGGHWAPLIRQRTAYLRQPDLPALAEAPVGTFEEVEHARRGPTQQFVGLIMAQRRRAFARRDLRIPDIQKFWPTKTPFRPLGIHKEILLPLKDRLILRSQLLCLRTLVEVFMGLRERRLIADATPMVAGMAWVALGRAEYKPHVSPVSGVLVLSEGRVFTAPTVQPDWALHSRRQAMVRTYLGPGNEPTPCVLICEIHPGTWQAVSLDQSRQVTHFVVTLPENDADPVRVISQGGE